MDTLFSIFFLPSNSHFRVILSEILILGSYVKNHFYRCLWLWSMKGCRFTMEYSDFHQNHRILIDFKIEFLYFEKKINRFSMEKNHQKK